MSTAENIRNGIQDLLNMENDKVKERKQHRILENALMIEKKCNRLHKQWRDGELPNKALTNELNPYISQLRNDIKIFDDEQIDKSNWIYPSMVETGSEILGRIYNRLQEFINELEQGSTSLQKSYESSNEKSDNKTSETLRKGLINEQKPNYIKYLIDSGYLYPDGKRVIKSIDDTAAALKDFLNKEKENNNENGKDILSKEIKITWQFLQEMFLQPDNTKYLEKTCKDAVRMANY